VETASTSLGQDTVTITQGGIVEFVAVGGCKVFRSDNPEFEKRVKEGDSFYQEYDQIGSFPFTVSDCGSKRMARKAGSKSKSSSTSDSETSSSSESSSGSSSTSTSDSFVTLNGTVIVTAGSGAIVQVQLQLANVRPNEADDQDMAEAFVAMNDVAEQHKSGQFLNSVAVVAALALVVVVAVVVSRRRRAAAERLPLLAK